MVKIKAGVIRSSAGNIQLGGLDITTASAAERVSRGIGYLIQGGEVFRDMSVYDNLVLGGYTLTMAEMTFRLQEIYKLFPKLQEMRLKRAGLLSGGERQSLALGMVLINHPQLLLLDEPSAGLSPALVKNTLSLVQEINQKYGTTISAFAFL